MVSLASSKMELKKNQNIEFRAFIHPKNDAGGGSGGDGDVGKRANKLKK